MSLTIMETVVRSWERKRRRLQARRESRTVDDVARREQSEHRARKLAADVAPQVGAALTEQLSKSLREQLRSLSVEAAHPSREGPVTTPAVESAAPDRDVEPPRHCDKGQAIAAEVVSEPAVRPAEPAAVTTPHPLDGIDLIGQGFEPIRAELERIRGLLGELIREVRGARESLGRSAMPTHYAMGSLPAAPPSRAPAPPAQEERRVPMGDVAGMIDQLTAYYR